MFTMHYDPQVDALYIVLRPADRGSVITHCVSETVLLDFEVDGQLAGIEVLGASSLMGNVVRSIQDARSEAGLAQRGAA